MIPLDLVKHKIKEEAQRTSATSSWYFKDPNFYYLPNNSTQAESTAKVSEWE